jgi:hypothetical protein
MNSSFQHLVVFPKTKTLRDFRNDNDYLDYVLQQKNDEQNLLGGNCDSKFIQSFTGKCIQTGITKNCLLLSQNKFENNKHVFSLPEGLFSSRNNYFIFGCHRDIHTETFFSKNYTYAGGEISEESNWIRFKSGIDLIKDTLLEESIFDLSLLPVHIENPYSSRNLLVEISYKKQYEVVIKIKMRSYIACDDKKIVFQDKKILEFINYVEDPLYIEELDEGGFEEYIPMVQDAWATFHHHNMVSEIVFTR